MSNESQHYNTWLQHAEEEGKMKQIEEENDGMLKKLREYKEKAKRFNLNKPKWHLVHMKSLEPLVRVMEFGADKYGPKDWMKGLDRETILDCLMRHLIALMDGEEVDSESLQHHIGHIMANAMMYSYFNVISEDKSSK